MLSTHNKPTTSIKPKTTPTFLLELPLQVDSLHAKHLRGHFEAARQLYNALLGEALKRLRQMRADPRWQEARLLPRSEKLARYAAFSDLRKAYGFTVPDLAMRQSPAFRWEAHTKTIRARKLGHFWPRVRPEFD